MKYFAGIVLFVAYIVLTPRLLLKNDFVSAVNRAKKASVEITAVCKDITLHGSGVIVNSEGRILTVAHLIPMSDCAIVVKPNDNKMYTAAVQKIDLETDLALLKIDKVFDNYAVLTPNDIFEGETVFSVSSPENIAGSITKGIVSNTDIKFPSLAKAYSFDMTVLPGASGSGIFTEKGKLVSLTASVLSSKEIPNTLTIGIKAATIKTFLEGTNDNHSR